jgi:hypothetical protein
MHVPLASARRTIWPRLHGRSAVNRLRPAARAVAACSLMVGTVRVLYIYSAGWLIRCQIGHPPLNISFFFPATDTGSLPSEKLPARHGCPDELQRNVRSCLSRRRVVSSVVNVAPAPREVSGSSWGAIDNVTSHAPSCRRTSNRKSEAAPTPRSRITSSIFRRCSVTSICACV